MNNTWKIILLNIVFMVIAGCVSSPDIPALKNKEQMNLDSLVMKYSEFRLFRSGIWSVYARYTDSGETVLDFNSGKGLAVGSNMKLLTSAAALDILGPDYRFRTGVYFDGSITSGTLTGNVYLAGSGDPSFLSGVIPSASTIEQITAQLAAECKKRGIQRIQGNIIADNSLIKSSSIPDDWIWGDLGTAYGAGSSALCVHENRVLLSFQVKQKKVVFIGSDPEIPYMNLLNALSVGAPDSPFLCRVKGLPRSPAVSVYGSVPDDGAVHSVMAAIPEPAFLASTMLYGALTKTGLAVTGKPMLTELPVPYKKDNLLCSVSSPPLKDIVFYLLKKSINLYAEQLCITLGLEKTGTASTQHGISVISAYLQKQKLPMEGIAINDGSGLSRYTSVTTKLIVGLLKNMTASVNYGVFYNALGAAGDPQDISFFSEWGTGTILAGNARIKSGSLRAVKAHSGYVTTRAGRLVAFSMIANNYNGEAEEVNEIHRQILTAIAALE